MAKPKPSPKPEPVESRLTFEAMRAAAAVYWGPLGAAVADEWRRYNDQLFDGALAPAAMVLSRMSARHNHWFPLLDRSASQITGYDTTFAAVSAYQHPPAFTHVRRSDLIRA
jgi:hypothetical protein